MVLTVALYTPRTIPSLEKEKKNTENDHFSHNADCKIIKSCFTLRIGTTYTVQVILGFLFCHNLQTLEEKDKNKREKLSKK